jgi:hypothetical protein
LDLFGVEKVGALPNRMVAWYFHLFLNTFGPSKLFSPEFHSSMVPQRREAQEKIVSDLVPRSL